MAELHFPWIEAAILLPVLGAMFVSRLKDRDFARVVSILFCVVTLGLTVGEFIDFLMLHTYEAHDEWSLVGLLLRREYLIVDELNAPLMPLTALLYLMTILSTLRTKIFRFSLGWTLTSLGLTLAIFSCRGGWVLIALLALSTIPPWIELRWRRREATRVYVIHMMAFVVLMVVGWALIPNDALNSPAREGVMDWRTIIGGMLLTVAALLRCGIVPLHLWMRDLFQRATFGTALLYVVPMPGAYAVMRLVLPIAPDWAMQSIALTSLITSVYAAGMALVETDARRFFCYLFLSHASLVLVGLELVTPIGLTGALCMWISVGLSLGGFGLTLRSVESRIGSLDMQRFHGLFEHMPTLASLFLLTGLASIGFPGTIGFIGTELIVEGAVSVYPFIGMAVVLAAAINGIAILRAYFRVFTGARVQVSFPIGARAPERIAVLVLTALILGGGLYPQPGVFSRYHAAKALLQHQRHRNVENATHAHDEQNSVIELSSESTEVNER